MAQNRRRHRRVKLNRVSTRLAAQGALHIGLAVENMSLGGCFVRSPTPLKVGTEVHLEIQRPGAATTINVRGRVVSIASPGPGRVPGMGIAFFPMPRDVSQRIEGLIGSVDPAAVRATIEASEMRTEPGIPALSRVPPPPAADAVAADLQEQLASLTELLKKKDARIAELEALVERLRQRLILYGGKL
ncbi:MAG: PilZ domain-containing protein [Myxococcota bacterium]|jgi:Tfp pilus assembly protein PilZ